MKSKAKTLLSLLLTLCMVGSLAACGDSGEQGDTGSGTDTGATETTETTPPADDGEPVYGGELVSYHSEFYGEFDPSASTMQNYVSFYTDMLWNIDWETDRDEFDFSTAYIDSNYITGQIAKEWDFADDYSSLTVHIRDDVFFQDKTAVGMDAKYDIYQGRQLVASDVKYTYDRLLGLDGVALVQVDMSTWTTDLAMLDSVEVVDDDTVIFHFNTADKMSVDKFMCAFINVTGPEWDALTDDQQSDWHYAAGTGPFILTDFTGDNTMNFTKNPKYWDTDAAGNPLPYLDEVQLVYMADTATILSSFLAGELDVIVSNNDILNSDQAAQLKSSLSEDQYRQYSYYGSPIGVGLKQGNNGHEALANLNVRKAMQYAIDTKSISDYYGYEYSDINEMICGVFAHGTAWNDVDAWDQDLVDSYTTYDVEKAKQILEEEGFGDGFTFDVTIFQMMPVDAFQLGAQYLAEVGITMNVHVVTSPNEMSAIGSDPDNPGSQFHSLGLDSLQMLSMAIPYDGGGNTIKQNNPEIDELFQTFISSGNVDDQVAAAKKLDQTYMAEHYLLMLTYSEQTTNWYRSNVQGLNGERPSRNYYFGYMYARTWVTE